MSKILKENIDGKKLKQIISNDSYRNEILERLRYAEVIRKETRQNSEGTNFINLINILHNTLDQLQEWSIEKYGVNKEEVKLTQKDFFKACPYTNTEKIENKDICKNCKSPSEFDGEEDIHNHMYEWIVTSDGLGKIDQLPEGE
ncbi:hypothetical protein [Spiroplasma chrysopicola]|uniref:Uncharacterized protein n=1 Tax=Spiroplasma chrysopicola DF-1 TaxID=1276227 RepID=R4U1H8_9MOLU|nr:hypothetical protein [Spiroplasma chrysopicola]AGM25157.1 hypothetical protein SCHRY_v1c05790 [Spiroplasma chrysopicola DF-1]AGM25514.1 hypothetical protein SCHRY_v1c09420 [Spiroplasma chrysopicola DF-1]